MDKLRSRLATLTTISLGVVVGVSNIAMAKDNIVVAFQGPLKGPTKCHLQKVAASVAKITGKKVEIHAGGSAFANPKKLFTQLTRGLTDMSVMPLAYTPGRFPLGEIITLPFVQKDHKALTYASTELIGKYLSKELKGTKPLAMMAYSPYNIHLKKPVKNIATELKGLRMRAVGKGLSNSIRAIGADVVGMPITQVYENMQKGVMNGFVLPNAPLIIFKLHEVADFHVNVNLSSPAVFMGMGKKFWDGLKSEHQKEIEAKYIGPKAAVRYVSCFDKLDILSLKVAAKKGGIVRDASAAELAQLKKIVKPIVDGYLASVEKKGLPAHKYYNELKSRAAEVAKSRMKK